jgi:hypothetical protein
MLLSDDSLSVVQFTYIWSTIIRRLSFGAISNELLKFLIIFTFCSCSRCVGDFIVYIYVYGVSYILFDSV